MYFDATQICQALMRAARSRNQSSSCYRLPISCLLYRAKGACMVYVQGLSGLAPRRYCPTKCYTTFPSILLHLPASYYISQHPTTSPSILPVIRQFHLLLFGLLPSMLDGVPGAIPSNTLSASLNPLVSTSSRRLKPRPLILGVIEGPWRAGKGA